MADYDLSIRIAALQEELKERFQDPRYIVLLTMFVLGFLHILGSIENDWFLVGPLTQLIRESIMPAIGPILRIVLGVLLAVFVWEVLNDLISGALGGLTSWISILLVALIIIFMIIGLPLLFGQGNIGFSVVGIETIAAP